MTVARVMPHPEMVHWWFATGLLMLALLLLAEAIVGTEVWGRRPWRRYLWPGLCFGLGVLMWPVMTFFTSSTIHMVAHGSWAEALMLAGAAELGLARGVPPSCARLDARRRRRVPARAGVPPALVHGRSGLCDDLPRHGSPALQRSRRRAGLRPSVDLGRYSA